MIFLGLEGAFTVKAAVTVGVTVVNVGDR